MGFLGGLGRGLGKAIAAPGKFVNKAVHQLPGLSRAPSPPGLGGGQSKQPGKVRGMATPRKMSR